MSLTLDVILPLRNAPYLLPRLSMPGILPTNWIGIIYTFSHYYHQ